MSGTGRLDDKKNHLFFIPRLIQDPVELDRGEQNIRPSKKDQVRSMVTTEIQGQEH
jgi:hypothetical protein